MRDCLVALLAGRNAEIRGVAQPDARPSLKKFGSSG